MKRIFRSIVKTIASLDAAWYDYCEPRREKKYNYDLSTHSGRALKDLHDSRWSWNRFPTRQINHFLRISDPPISWFKLHILRIKPPTWVIPPPGYRQDLRRRIARRIIDTVEKR